MNNISLLKFSDNCMVTSSIQAICHRTFVARPSSHRQSSVYRKIPAGTTHKNSERARLDDVLHLAVPETQISHVDIHAHGLRCTGRNGHLGEALELLVRHHHAGDVVFDVHLDDLGAVDG